jgi:FKBP-type peptidyl-prolyl cis-trans isomerase SlyD
LVVDEKMIGSIYFTMTDNYSNVIDRTQDDKPLSYLHGVGELVYGLEKSLNGKAAGESLQITVEPTQAYGEINLALIRTLARSMFASVEPIMVGLTVEIETQKGETKKTVIKEINGNQVIVDANHSLAGHTLHYEVEIVSLRKATPAEIAQHYVH